MINLGKKAKIVAIVGTISQAILYMYILPFGSFSPKEMSFYLIISFTIISNYLFDKVFRLYLEKKRNQAKE